MRLEGLVREFRKSLVAVFPPPVLGKAAQAAGEVTVDFTYFPFVSFIYNFKAI